MIILFSCDHNCQAINEKPTIITEYEAGRAIPNGGIIVKLERVLQVSLPRPPKIKKTRPDE
jgi:ribosome-binding protein aMBF1 (putative translation factor)